MKSTLRIALASTALAAFAGTATLYAASESQAPNANSGMMGGMMQGESGGMTNMMQMMSRMSEMMESCNKMMQNTRPQPRGKDGPVERKE